MKYVPIKINKNTFVLHNEDVSLSLLGSNYVMNNEKEWSIRANRIFIFFNIPENKKMNKIKIVLVINEILRRVDCGN